MRRDDAEIRKEMRRDDAEIRASAPLWNSARQLTCGAVTPLMSLHVELWQTGKVEHLLAFANVPSSTLGTNEPLTVVMRPYSSEEGEPSMTLMKPSQQSTITLQQIESPIHFKTVSFIRHGESRWNEAQAKKNVMEMVSHVDHPLNETGYAQAYRLQHAIRAALTSSTDVSSPLEAAAVRSLVSAQALWCSPLTRAVQTALVALQPLLSSSGMSLHLKPNAREKKNFGGRDTIGQSLGADCGTRATSLLRALAGAEDFARCEQAAQFDVTEVEQQWWVTAAESKEEVDVRMDELINQIHYCPHERIVLVGHSHFFRALFQRFLHSEVQRREPELARKLCEDVMPNCAVVSCQFDFSRGPRMITDLILLQTARTPHESYNLVIQRELEQLVGPVIHLFSARNVPHREGLGRSYARMWPWTLMTSDCLPPHSDDV